MNSIPLQLDEKAIAKYRRRNLLLSLTCILLGAVLLAVAFFEYRDISREKQIWRTGKTGNIINIGGKYTENTLLFIPLYVDYDLKIDFEDEAGQPKFSNSKFKLVFGDIDEKREIILKYSPDNPKEIVISPAIEHPWARAGLGIAMLIGGLCFLAGPLLFKREYNKQERAWKACLEDGQASVALSLSAASYQKQYFGKYRLLNDPTDQQRGYKLDRAPLILEIDSGQQLIVLVRSASRPELMVVLGEDHFPFLEGEAIVEAALENRT